MKKHVKARLIDDARLWWKMWSVRAAGIFAAVLTAMAANPAPVLQYLNSLPDSFKPFVPVLTLVVTFGVPTLLRLWRQPKIAAQGKTDEPDKAGA